MGLLADWLVDLHLAAPHTLVSQFIDPSVNSLVCRLIHLLVG
jgi:hypothetical protein